MTPDTLVIEYYYGNSGEAILREPSRDNGLGPREPLATVFPPRGEALYGLPFWNSL